MADKKEDFLSKTIQKDLAKQEGEQLSDFLEKKFTKELKKSKLIEKEKERKKKKPKKWVKVTVFTFVILIILGIVGYFLFVSSAFAIKPWVEKPALQTPDDFNEDHIKYIVNELGGYKLHASPVDGRSAQIELRLSDTGQIFTITARSRKAIVALGEAPNPDLRVVMTIANVMELLAAEDMGTKAMELYNNNQIGFGMISSAQVLTIKGYQGIFEELTNSSLGVFGLINLGSEFKAALYMIIVLLVSVFTIWYLVYK